jgi:hypothetical protein
MGGNVTDLTPTQTVQITNSDLQILLSYNFVLSHLNIHGLARAGVHAGRLSN